MREMMRISGRTGEVKPARFSSEPVVSTDEPFMTFVEENVLVVVDLWGPWFGPCRFVSPIIDAMARDYASKIVFWKFNFQLN